MDTLTYIGLIRKDPESDYGVDFPDFPGCVSAGATLEELRDMATEALGVHTEVMVESGEEIPPPSSLEKILADPDNGDALPILVAAKISSKAVRINITVNQIALKKIDAYSKRKGLSRSAFLAQAAEKLMRE